MQCLHFSLIFSNHVACLFFDRSHNSQAKVLRFFTPTEWSGSDIGITATGPDPVQAVTVRAKWCGAVGGIVDAPIGSVWKMVSQSSKLPEWMPMVEKCTTLAGEEGIPGYVRLVSGFMFPQDDGDRSWIKERLVFMDPSSFSHIYMMEASNIGLDGSVNFLKLIDYGEDSTLVDWTFEIEPLDGACEGDAVDYLGFLYRSCINRIEGATQDETKRSLGH